LLLLVFSAEEVDQHAGDPHVDRHGEPRRRARAREFLHDDGVGQVVGAGAAVLRRDGDPHPAALGELLEEIGRMAFLLVDLRGDGLHVLHAEFPDVFADEFLFLGQLEIHDLPPSLKQ
jgi:hypothetical protein